MSIIDAIENLRVELERQNVAPRFTIELDDNGYRALLREASPALAFVKPGVSAPLTLFGGAVVVRPSRGRLPV